MSDYTNDENVSEVTEDINGGKCRYRISHKYTQRDGWKFETTVEIVAADNPEAVEQMLRGYLRMTDELGRNECELRNDSDKNERLYKERQEVAA